MNRFIVKFYEGRFESRDHLNFILFVICLVVIGPDSGLLPTAAFAGDAFKNQPVEMVEATFSHLSIKEIEKVGQTASRYREIVKTHGFYVHIVRKHSIYEILRSPLFRHEGVEEIRDPARRLVRLNEL